MKIDRTNKPWNNIITDEDILNKEYSLAYLIQSKKKKIVDITKNVK